jgi:hypothetical protein
MRSFVTCTLRQYNWNDQVKEDEMGRKCSKHKINAYRFLGEKSEGKKITRKTLT